MRAHEGNQSGEGDWFCHVYTNQLLKRNCVHSGQGGAIIFLKLHVYNLRVFYIIFF